MKGIPNLNFDPAFNGGSKARQTNDAAPRDQEPALVAMSPEDRRERVTALGMKFFGGKNEEGEFIPGLLPKEAAVTKYSRRIIVGTHKPSNA